MALKVLAISLFLLGLIASDSYADHERFIVGAMRNVDPAEKILTSTSGACVPSHDRERLECYFTSFGMWNAKTEEETKKDFEQVTQELDKDHVKQIKEMKTSFCDDKKMMKPDPIRLKYNTGYRTFLASLTAFCERPTRDSALGLFRAMGELDAKKWATASSATGERRSCDRLTAG